MVVKGPCRTFGDKPGFLLPIHDGPHDRNCDLSPSEVPNALVPPGPEEFRVTDGHVVLRVIRHLDGAPLQSHQVILSQVVYTVNAQAMPLRVLVQAGALCQTVVAVVDDPMGGGPDHFVVEFRCSVNCSEEPLPVHGSEKGTHDVQVAAANPGQYTSQILQSRPTTSHVQEAYTHPRRCHTSCSRDFGHKVVQNCFVSQLP